MNITKLPHPFLNHPETIEIPKDRIDQVEELYEWILEQPSFPNYSKNHAYLFYHACVWDMALSKKALRKYAEIRASSQDIFGNRDPLDENLQKVAEMVEMAAMPKKTKENYKILMYRLLNTDSSKFHFISALKGFCMFNDIQITENLIAEGYIVVFDMKGFGLSHLTRIQISALRAFMAYIQEAHPARLKKVYVVNTWFLINQIMALLKPMIKSELLNLLHFSTGGPTTVLPEELLPEDYGGKLDKMSVYAEKQRKDIETIYRDWLIDSGNLKEMLVDKVQENKGCTKTKNNHKNNVNKNNNLIKPLNDLCID